MFCHRQNDEDLTLKIGLLGGTGQLGRSLLDDLSVFGEVIAPNRQQLDLSNSSAVCTWLTQQQCDLLINAAAMTQVDLAEKVPDVAYQLNHGLVLQLAEYAAAHQIWLVHFSTDYVFDGEGSNPWRETDECRPLQKYGLSKRAGELALIASGCLHLIIRTSWLYDVQGHNFLLTMLRLASQRDVEANTVPLKIVSDQIGAPTFAPELSRQVSEVLQQLLAMPATQSIRCQGTYHLCALENCSWFDFAAAIFAGAKARGIIEREPLLQDIKSIELVRPAIRPKNSRLDTTKVQTTFQVALTTWQQQLQQCLDLLKNPIESGN